MFPCWEKENFPNKTKVFFWIITSNPYFFIISA